jgi:ADP-heptose:LPS heptosyltransferase
MIISRKIKAYLLRRLTSRHSVNFDIKQTKNVLFLRYDRIGDMVISTPVFRELKTVIPNIKILVLASKKNKNVLKDNPYVDEIIINNKNNLFVDFFKLMKLRKRNLDVCIELDHSVIPHSIMRLRIINPKKIISVVKDGRYGVRGDELIMYDFFTKKKENMHFRDIWLQTIKPFGVESTFNNYDLFTSQKQDKIASDFLLKYAKQLKIGINLEGAVKDKKIQDIELENICKKIKKKHIDIQIILLSAPEKFKKVNQLQKKMNLTYVVSSYKTNTIQDIAALIKNLDLIITPDTSISHISSAFQKPIITIHENNQDSYKLFAPTSHLNRTVFSKSKNSLNGFSSDLLLKYCFELIDLIKKDI